MLENPKTKKKKKGNEEALSQLSKIVKILSGETN